MEISHKILRKIIRLFQSLDELPPPALGPSQAKKVEEFRAKEAAQAASAKRELIALLEQLPETKLREVVALYYLGRGEARTFNEAQKRVAKLDAEHLSWTLLQSGKLDERLLQGLAIYTRGRFELYPSPKVKKTDADASSPEREAPDVESKAMPLARDPGFAPPQLQPLAALLERFSSGEERSIEYVESMARQFDLRLSNIFPDLTFELIVYLGPEDAHGVERIVVACKKALLLRLPEGPPN